MHACVRACVSARSMGHTAWAHLECTLYAANVVLGHCGVGKTGEGADHGAVSALVDVAIACAAYHRGACARPLSRAVVPGPVRVWARPAQSASPFFVTLWVCVRALVWARTHACARAQVAACARATHHACNKGVQRRRGPRAAAV